MSRPTNDLSATNRAFLTLVCVIVWLIVAPAFFLVGLCKGLRAAGDGLDDDAHQCCAADPITVHSGEI